VNKDKENEIRGEMKNRFNLHFDIDQMRQLWKSGFDIRSKSFHNFGFHNFTTHFSNGRND